VDLLTPAEALPAVEHLLAVVLDPSYKLVTSHVCRHLAFAAVMDPRVILLQMLWFLLTHVTREPGELTVYKGLLLVPSNRDLPLCLWL
jgi:hypothetical protein